MYNHQDVELVLTMAKYCIIQQTDYCSVDDPQTEQQNVLFRNEDDQGGVLCRKTCVQLKLMCVCILC